MTVGSGVPPPLGGANAGPDANSSKDAKNREKAECRADFLIRYVVANLVNLGIQFIPLPRAENISDL